KSGGRIHDGTNQIGFLAANVIGRAEEFDKAPHRGALVTGGPWEDGCTRQRQNRSHDTRSAKPEQRLLTLHRRSQKALLGSSPRPQGPNGVLTRLRRASRSIIPFGESSR